MILRSYPVATAAEKSFLANLVNMQAETFKELAFPLTVVSGNSVSNNSLTVNGAWPEGVTATVNETVTLNQLTYDNTIQEQVGGRAGGGLYGIAPISQCVVPTAVNVSTTDAGCLNSQQNLLYNDLPFPNQTPNPQSCLRGAATQGAVTSLDLTFNQLISAFGF